MTDGTPEKTPEPAEPPTLADLTEEQLAHLRAQIPKPSAPKVPPKGPRWHP